MSYNIIYVVPSVLSKLLNVKVFSSDQHFLLFSQQTLQQMSGQLQQREAEMADIFTS